MTHEEAYPVDEMGGIVRSRVFLVKSLARKGIL